MTKEIYLCSIPGPQPKFSDSIEPIAISIQGSKFDSNFEEIQEHQTFDGSRMEFSDDIENVNIPFCQCHSILFEFLLLHFSSLRLSFQNVVQSMGHTVSWK